jgi:hypothetical protein
MMLGATLEVKGTHDVKVNDIIDVIYLDSISALTQTGHYLSGKYTVKNLTHSVGSGGWTTTFDLNRKGLPAHTAAQDVTGNPVGVD